MPVNRTRPPFREMLGSAVVNTLLGVRHSAAVLRDATSCQRAALLSLQLNTTIAWAWSRLTRRPADPSLNGQLRRSTPHYTNLLNT
jgi:hypothetical protein